ncbi:hypothetical protein ABHA37_08150 [Clostridium tertium]|uniref:hypothetical protein n=2 Tax=Clostridium tertium TaxID=1559 RepID=UPI0023304737|nr:hypothetical protein [Clostridium tertium]MDB1929989.1 hypothetical protein [Clostridium tertium]
MNNSTSIYENLMKEAIKERNKLTSETVNRLRRLYEDVADDLLKKASTARGGFTRAWTSDYEKYMRSKIMELDSALVNLTKDSILTSAEIAASVNGDFLSFVNEKYQLDIDKDLINIAYNVNNDVIGQILQGGLYKDNRSLSERIWRYSDNTMSDIQYIITKGMVEQKSYPEIIKDLEKYVDPTAKKPWNFGTVYPNLKNKQVDFNAQRLLRTSINHSFFASNMAKAKENPYIEAVHWNLSSAHYDRQVKIFGEDICDEYANQDRYKLGTGNFPKDNVPLPHPQCLCYQSMVITKSLDDIGKDLGMWVRGGNNLILDNWFNGNTSPINTKVIDKYTEIYDKWDKKNVKTFAQKLLVEENLPLKVQRHKISANGQCALNVNNSNMKVLSYELNSGDNRSIEYQIKTAFHELFHAKSNGLKHDIGEITFRDWAFIDDVFAEATAHYLNKKIGIDLEIAPSYSGHLIEALPKLKTMPIFKECKTLVDFGEVAYNYRFGNNTELNASWKEINTVLNNNKNDIINYSKYYTNYINSNKDSLIDKLLENMPNYKSYRENMISDLEEALNTISKGNLPKNNAKMIFDNALIISMNRLGVK